jgi:hypothetical protein
VTEVQVPPAVYVRLDLSPATLTGPALPGGRLDRRRAIITDAYVLVFADAAGGPVLEYELTLDKVTGKPATGYDVLTEEGLSFHVSRSTGCLCGSRLRGLRPYPSTPYTGVTS